MIDEKKLPFPPFDSELDPILEPEAADDPKPVHKQIPVVFPSDVGAAQVGQRIKLVVQPPAPPEQAVVPASFRVSCDAPDLRRAHAPQCVFCKIHANGGADEIVELALPLEELTEAARSTQKFLEKQARRRVRCRNDCSKLEVLERRDIFFQSAFEPLCADRKRPPLLTVEVMSNTGLPTGAPLLVAGRVIERSPQGMSFTHDGTVEPAPESPGREARLQARLEIERFFHLQDPLIGLAHSVQRDIAANSLSSMTDLTLGVLLALFSPIGLPLRNGREVSIHRLNIIAIGDTGVRKSATIAAIVRDLGFGELILTTSTVPGLIGTVGRYPRWGALVREHRGLVLIEESGTLKREVIAAIRDLRERGLVSIHLNGASYYAPAAPAIIETCNPGMNRTLSSFSIWAEALTSLPNHDLADLRRCALLIALPAESLSATPIDSTEVPPISAATVRTVAWIARTIGPDRISLDEEALTCADAAEAEIRPLLPAHPAIQAIANHAANKILHLASAWAVAAAVPLENEKVRVTAEHVKAVLPLFRRTLLAWTTRGDTPVVDPEKVAEIVRLLRDAAHSLGRKPRTDPLAGLRVLSAAPIGLTIMEWSARMAVSDKTIRNAWLRPLLEPFGLVERKSTRYWITSLGRAVVAAAEESPPHPPASTPQPGSRENTENAEGPGANASSAECHSCKSCKLPPVRAIGAREVSLAAEPEREAAEKPEALNGAAVAKRIPLLPPEVTIDNFPTKPEDGTLRRMTLIRDDRPKSQALFPTGGGGFLETFSHTFNPAVGCVFACFWCGKYCYARWETPARLLAEQLGLQWGEYLIVKQRIAEALERDLSRAMRRDIADPLHVSQFKIFMSAVTEPCAGPVLPVTRECLRILARYPIGRLVLQTRSPRVVELLPELKALGERVVVSLTVESDVDEIWRDVEPPMVPRVRDRREAVALLNAERVPTSVTVSPCARIADPEAFAVWMGMNSTFVVIDTFLAGDGMAGNRTEKTEIPSLFAAQGWDWSDESAAHDLYRRVRALIGDRAGWSKEGFNRLATIAIPAR